MTTFAELFTSRQLVALTTFSDLIGEVREYIISDMQQAGVRTDGVPLFEGVDSVEAYAKSLVTYLALALSRWTDLSNSICGWNTTNQNISHIFTRQAISMAWDFAELNPFGNSVKSEIFCKYPLR